MRALVLKRIPYGESDLIVHFIVAPGQRLSGFAAGAKRSKQRFAHRFTYEGLYEVEGLQTDKLARIHRCDLVDFHRGGLSLEGLTLWAQVSEWILMHDNEDFEFSKLEGFWRLLGDSAQAQDRFFRFFIEEWQKHGIQPILDRCAVCSRPLTDVSELRFSFQHHGIVHIGCAPGLAISTDIIQFLRGDYERLLPIEMADKLSQIVVPFIESQMGRAFKSRSLS